MNSTLGTSDLLVANGVTLDGTVSITFGDLGSGPWTGSSEIVVIDNTSGDAISGFFANYAEGAAVSIGGNSFIVTYKGGTGNDFALTAVPEPDASSRSLSHILQTPIGAF